MLLPFPLLGGQLAFPVVLMADALRLHPFPLRTAMATSCLPHISVSRARAPRCRVSKHFAVGLQSDDDNDDDDGGRSGSVLYQMYKSRIELVQHKQADALIPLPVSYTHTDKQIKVQV